ncbi:MAG: GNAT family N-acetyltransferase [Streptosporangiaceae bacterium]
MTKPGFPETTLETKRLVLRAYEEADIPDVRKACRDPLTQRWIAMPDPYTEEVARHWCLSESHEPRLNGEGLNFVAVPREGGRIVGGFGVSHTHWQDRVAEVGYWVAPWARGRGYAPEAVGGIARWLFETHGFMRLQLRAAPDNHPSTRVADKCGFVREGVQRSAGVIHGGRTDLVVYGLLPEDLR